MDLKFDAKSNPTVTLSEEPNIKQKAGKIAAKKLEAAIVESSVGLGKTSKFQNRNIQQPQQPIVLLSQEKDNMLPNTLNLT